MGRRGQPKQPTALKIARGNPGKRPLNELEPEFEAPQGVEPPADLTGAGLVEWHQQLPRLTGSGVLTAADMSGFITYCRLIEQEEWCLQRWITAVASHNPLDREVEMKYSSHLLKITTAKRGWAQHYGITPSSRSGVKAKKPANAADERRKKFGLLGGGSA